MRCAMCWAQSPACCKPRAHVNYHGYCAIQNTGALSHTHPDTYPMLLPARDCESSLHESSNSLLWLTLALYSLQASPTTPISPCQNTAGHFAGSTEVALERPCLIPLLNIHEPPDMANSIHLYLPGLPYTPGHVPPERQDRSRQNRPESASCFCL